MRYFKAENANRRIGKNFFFQLTEILGGCQMGVYATEDEKEIEELREIVSNLRNGVREINEQDYRASLEKKRPEPASFTNLRQSYHRIAEVRGAGVSPAENPNGTAEPAGAPKTVENIESVLQVQTMEPGSDPAPATPTAEKASKKKK